MLEREGMPIDENMTNKMMDTNDAIFSLSLSSVLCALPGHSRSAARLIDFPLTGAQGR